MKCAYCNAELTDQMLSDGFCFQCGKPIHFNSNGEISKEEAAHKKADRIEHIKQIYEATKNLKLTTGFNFEGYKIIDYLKVISAETVLGTGFLSEFSASISDFFGTENESFSEKLESAKNSATKKLINKAILLNANGIIGIDYDYVNFSSNIIGVIANGTAVKIEKCDI